MKRIIQRSFQAFLMTVALLFLFLMQPAIAATSANILTNGSFEAGTGNGTGSKIAGWTLKGGQDTVVRLNWRTDRYPPSPFQGSFVAPFNRAGKPAKGVLYQSFTTVPGTKYQLTFSSYENGNNGAAASKVQVQVKGKTSLLNKTVEATKQGWQKSSFNFVADSKTTTLSFSDRSTGNLASTDFVLDSVSVKIISKPKPSTSSRPIVINKAPIVSIAIAGQPGAQATVTTRENCSFTLASGSFTDPDGDKLSLSASLANGKPLPAWLSFDPATGKFSGTPPVGSEGSLDIKVTASDPQNSSVSDNFTLNINGAPVVSIAIAGQPGAQATVTTGNNYSFTLASDTFTDPDGDKLSLSASLANGSPLPAWLSFDPATGKFSGTPPVGSEGSLDIKVTASDPQNSSVSDNFTLNINGAPVVSIAIAGQLGDNAISTQPYSFTLASGTFTDPDGDNLSLSASLANGDPLPAWLSFNATTGEFTGIPANADVGSIKVKVTVIDPQSSSVSDTFTLEVESALALKDTVTNPNNGHTYYLTEPLTWTEAQAEAESFGGNLVTINNQEELDWLTGEFGIAEPFWIGLNDVASEGTFEWMSGEAFTYDNWNSDEPNSGYYGGEDEDYVVMNFTVFGDWGDVPNDGPGYGDPVPGIVEIEL